MTMKRMLLSLVLRLLFAVAVLGSLVGTAHSQYATLTGTLQASNGLPASNYVISFQPSQFGFVAGTGVVINSGTYCATSTNGNVVGLPNPLQRSVVTVGFTGTLPPANYFVKVAFYDSLGNVTLPSPETQIQLDSTGRLIIPVPPNGLPYGATGMRVYIATSTNAETLQGSTTGSGAYLQTVALTSGSVLPASNTTICKQIANDAIWPTGTGYTVALTDPAGNTLPGYPMQWQLIGPNTTINLSSGLPYYHGTVFFPSPILASPLNNALQSIAGPLSLSGYNLINVGAIGVGTTLPAWPIDVENGLINSSGGYLYNGAAPNNHLLCGNGTAYVDCATIPSSAISGIFYQTVDEAGTPLTQRSVLNFDGTVVASDSSSPARTNVGLPNKGTAGVYTSPVSITFDAQGRETAITAGSAVSRTCPTSASCYIVQPDGTIIEWGVVPGCGAGGACSSTITFPLAFTTTTNLSIVGSCNDAQGNCIAHPQVASSWSTTGFSMQFAPVVFVGGAGSNLDGNETAGWTAIGH